VALAAGDNLKNFFRGEKCFPLNESSKVGVEGLHYSP